MLTLLSEQSYRRNPWKNGNGMTEEVLLLPEGASHEDFDIRVSRATIGSEAAFSAFPGIDRIITRLDDNPLVLCFADGEQQMEQLVPLPFDSALTPTSRLPAGETRVMNVMTRRGRWLSTVRTLHGPANETLDVPSEGFVLVHAVASRCMVEDKRVAAGETMLARDVAQVRISLRAGEACLTAKIQPTPRHD